MEGGWRLCQFGSTMEAGQAVPHRHKLGRHVDRTCGSARSPLGRGRERGCGKSSLKWMEWRAV